MSARLTGTVLVVLATVALLGACNDPSRAGGSAPVTFEDCAQAQKAGVAPMRRGQPGYSWSLDKNGDGVACEDY